MEISCSDNVIATHPGHFVKWPHIHGPPSSLMYSRAALIKYVQRARRFDVLHLAGFALNTAIFALTSIDFSPILSDNTCSETIQK